MTYALYSKPSEVIWRFRIVLHITYCIALEDLKYSHMDDFYDTFIVFFVIVELDSPSPYLLS